MNLSQDLLDYYLSFSPAFKKYIRTISSGWALDGTNLLVNGPSSTGFYGKYANNNLVKELNPLERLEYAHDIGLFYKDEELQSYQKDISNWSYMNSSDGSSSFRFYSYYNLDSFISDELISYWIPSDINELFRSTINCMIDLEDNDDYHHYSYTFDYNLSLMNVVNLSGFKILDQDKKVAIFRGIELKSNLGYPLKDILYLLNIVFDYWYEIYKPSISDLEGVIDIKKKEGQRIIILPEIAYISSVPSYYRMSKSKESPFFFSEKYIGRAYLIEGVFDVLLE